MATSLKEKAGSKHQAQFSKALRIKHFTDERVSTLKSQILSSYEVGVGISGTRFCDIVFGYQQALYMYEFIAYKFFGLIVTRDPNKKRGPLYLVSMAEAGKTRYPVAHSELHDYDKITKGSSLSSKSNTSTFDKQILAILSSIANSCKQIAEAIKK